MYDQSLFSGQGKLDRKLKRDGCEDLIETSMWGSVHTVPIESDMRPSIAYTA